MLPIAFTATMQGIPIIHIHGGEITLGAIDTKMRFAISHLADLHLTATKNRNNVLSTMELLANTLYLRCNRC